MDKLKEVSNVIKTKLDIVLKNAYFMTVLKIVIALYAAQLAPNLPTKVSVLFKNTFVKIFAVAFIAYLAEVDFQLAILLAIVFVLSTNLLSGRSILESYQNENQGNFYKDQTKYNNLLGEPSIIGTANLIESQSDNYPGCNSVTVADLLNVFDGDHMKLQTTVKSSYVGLMNELPAESDAKTRLDKITRSIGLPYNVILNEKSAPIIATLLINAGFVVNKTCSPPN